MTFETVPQDEELTSESSAKMQRKRTVRKPKARSRVTNGGKLLMGDVDERSQFARRLRDIIALHVDCLSRGAGGEALSEAELSLIRRVSVCELRLEEMEMRMAQGKDISIDVYARVAGHVRRMHEALNGLSLRNKVAKDVTPSLGQYVSKRQRRVVTLESGD
ncbi:hypothetical protein [Methylocystis echinoides]|uniref:hypothetical protein n=1 Tax=Methylocystis echinoides TaxID=29468 RepID=UPI003440BF2E